MHERPTNPMNTTGGQSTALRPATAADRDPLRRLAELDSAPRLTGQVLVAERAGRLVAAIALGSGAVIADPFQRTAPVVTMLALQRRDLHRAPDAGRRRSLRTRRRQRDEMPSPLGVGA